MGLLDRILRTEAFEIVSPADGTVIPVGEVNDETFSKEIIGPCVAIEPTSGLICSPVDGVVSLTFPTKHGIGIVGKDETEFLIHVGIDTVKLGGEGFKILVEQDQKVKKGQPLVEADLEFIKKSGYYVTTMLVVCSFGRYDKLVVSRYGDCRQGDAVARLEG